MLFLSTFEERKTHSHSLLSDQMPAETVAPVQAWITARSANDFSKFAPVLEEWIELTKKRSKCIDSSLPPYDVALQDYEKGMSSARLDQIFSQVNPCQPCHTHPPYCSASPEARPLMKRVTVTYITGFVLRGIKMGQTHLYSDGDSNCDRRVSGVALRKRSRCQPLAWIEM